MTVLSAVAIIYIKPGAVVSDYGLDPTTKRSDLYGDFRSLRVLSNVGKGFLDYSIHRKLCCGRKAWHRAPFLTACKNPCIVFEFASVSIQGFNQSNLLQLWGMHSGSGMA